MRRLGIVFISVLWLATASCSPSLKKLDKELSIPANTEITMGSESGTETPEIAPPKMPPGPMKITILEALLLSLENNRALVVQRLNPSIVKTFEDQERALFDPVTDAEISAGRDKAQRLARSGTDTENFTTDTVSN
jgi:hypothetical protein